MHAAAVALAATALLPCSAATMAAALSPPPLLCTLSAPAAVTGGRALKLRLSLRNPGPRDVQVLTWGTPFEGWFAPFVKVWRDGGELAYEGPSIKRGEPERDEYLRIAAGRSRAVVFDLRGPFDLSQAGHYRVQPQIALHDAFVTDRKAAVAVPRPRDRHAGQALACNSVEFTITAAPR